QTWLCAVPLVMGFVGLGLSLMLLKWIVVGSVQDYVPTDLVDPKSSMGQDPIFLSKPSTAPRGGPADIPSAGTSAEGTAAGAANGADAAGRAPHLPNHVGVAPPSGKEVWQKNGNVGSGRGGPPVSKPGQSSGGVPGRTTPSSTAAAQPSAPAKPTSRWTPGRQAKGPATRPHHRYRTPTRVTRAPPPAVVAGWVGGGRRRPAAAAAAAMATQRKGAAPCAPG
ncbi:hypothetical protein NHX12_024451, partial [Muraenolepis orangiensis]